MSDESAGAVDGGANDADADGDEGFDEELELAGEGRPSVRKIVVRVVLVVAALGVSGWLLVTTFDDLDIDEIRSAIGSLGDAELLSLFSMWLLWLGAQGLLTASLIPGLPVRRGVVAYLGPAAVTSLVPGPSDLPVRHRMLRSWGRSASEATLAVTAGGLFSIGIKLVLPVIAAVGLLVSGSPIDGTLRTIAVVAVFVGLGLVVFGFVLGSEGRTHRIGRWLDPVWRFSLRRLGRPHEGDLSTKMVQARASALETLEGRWLLAAWGTALTASTRFALLLMALRFMDVPESALSWTQVFVVFALVQGLTVLPITAGDVGVSEVAYIGLLTAAAGQEYVNAVTAAVVVFRVLTWLIIIPVGFGALAVWRRSVRTAVRSGRSPAPPSPT